MKIIIDGLSNRRGIDGWAVFEKGAACPLPDTFCTVRSEARAIRRAMQPDLFRSTVVDKAVLEIRMKS
jgi:hypothetical protein